ncbi:amino acid adenylation domain-containing protein [Streptantibioticus parmotrematis]|uniref:non-ribosomal peptide synthetase n=1 Tax=Streptantibioticus parmotrematis TaxID=2873249 RepID=UPI0033DB659F
MDPAPLSLPEALAEQALRTPDATAVRDANGRLTYRELQAHVAGCAQALHDRGVRPSDVVALRAARGTPVVVALLGVLAAGAACLPLDPGEPAIRTAGLLADARVTLALVDESGLAPGAVAAGIEVLSLAQLRSAGPATEPPPGPRDAQQAAFVLSTSGTTGPPKAVSVPHRGVLRLVRDQEFVRFGPRDTVLQHSPLSFDASLLEIFGPLLNGGELVIAPPGRLSPADLGKVLHEFRVTTLYLTASLLHLVVDEELAALSEVRVLLTGGEPASTEHLERARLALPDCRFVEGYGPTETTVFSTTFTIDPKRPVPSPVPIGRPIAGAEVYVVGPDGRVVPDGELGELWLGGAGLSNGYLGAPELTEQRFVPHLDGTPGRRLYRSGDLGRRGPDGDIVFAGRIDDQVKIEGHRIEPGEIEHALRRHPRVADAFVHAVREPGTDQRLVAYLVPAAGQPPLDTHRTREHLAALLPPYLVPGQYMWLEELPLKANGKVDRLLLPSPAAATQPRAQLSLTEDQVARIWCEVLRLEAVGPGDDFFGCGGTSIGASRVVARIRARLGVELPLAVMFENPTLARVAQAVEGARRATPEPVAPSPGPAPTGEFTAPASLQQRARLGAYRAAADGGTQPVLILHRLRGPLDVAALRSALDALTVRHDILATRYREDPDFVAVIAPAAGRHWPLEVRTLPRGRHEAEIEAIRGERGFGRLPFDMAHGPVVRALLVTDGASEHVLALCVDHIAFDEVSAEILVGELAALYGQAHGHAPAALGPVTQYQEYARRQAEQYAAPEGRAALARAVDQLYLRGFRPPLPLPAHPGHDPLTTGRTATVERELPRVPAATDAALAARGITPACFYLSVLARAVGEVVDGEEFGFQISQSGRHLPGADTTIGCLTELAFVHFERRRCAEPGELFEDARQQLVRLVTDPPPLAAALAQLRAEGRGAEVERLRKRPYLLFHHRQELPVTPFTPDLRLTALRPALRPGTRHDPALVVTSRSGPDGGAVLLEYVEAAYPRDLIATLADAVVTAVTDLGSWAGSR